MKAKATVPGFACLSRHPYGLTLLELLVTFSIFALVLVLTLFFYGQSLQANRRHDQGSEVYRRAHAVFGDIERLLGQGVLMLATEKELMLAAYPAQGLVTPARALNWSPRAQVLAVLDGNWSCARVARSESSFASSPGK